MVKHKETESESEGGSHVEDPHFRIAVCLKRFYSDHRARALLYVSARRRVRWLQRRLRRLFALPSALVLLCRGHLLPRDEPLALLDRDDLVEVVPAPVDVDPTPTTREVPSDSALPDVAATAAAEEGLRSRPPTPAAPAEEPEWSPLSAAGVGEPKRSPSPDRPDDLSESKRRALLVLDQYCSGPAEPVMRVKRRRVRRRRRVPALTEREHSVEVFDEEHSLESVGNVFREPDTAAVVLRNDMLPRAPRLVRDVSRCDVMTCDAPRCDVETCNVPRCNVECSDVCLSAVVHVSPLTKIPT